MKDSVVFKYNTQSTLITTLDCYFLFLFLFLFLFFFVLFFQQTGAIFLSASRMFPWMKQHKQRHAINMNVLKQNTQARENKQITK